MKLVKIIFSPTGGTAKVADAITANWTHVEAIDLASNQDNGPVILDEQTLALVAIPSFGGVAPQLALDRLRKIQANHAKCVIVAVYGNRAYDDTLLQMKDYAEQAGFEVIAAVSAVAEHSIVRAYAASRPDANDCKQLCSFGQRILEKASQPTGTISVPGNKPYKKAGASMVPKAGSGCTSCGSCAKLCPAGAISVANPHETDKSKCIGCMRCVSVCPAKARKISPIMTKLVAFALKKACSTAKQNELMI